MKLNKKIMFMFLVAGVSIVLVPILINLIKVKTGIDLDLTFLFLVLSIILFIVRGVFIYAERNSHYSSDVVDGLITRSLYDEYGYRYFYIAFELDGECYEGKTVSYKRVGNKYYKGDLAKIQYRFYESGFIRVDIVDDEIEKFDSKTSIRTSSIIFLVCVCLLIIFFVKDVLIKIL